jgi:hypothetical protein
MYSPSGFKMFFEIVGHPGGHLPERPELFGLLEDGARGA